MFCRWLIRGLALTLLTLCVGAWGGSYWKMAIISRIQGVMGDNGYEARLVNGRMRLTSDFWLIGSDAPWEWYASLDDTDGFSWNEEVIRFHLDDFQFFGFSAQSFRMDDKDYGFERYKMVAVPLWFPALLSSLLLWFVWRNTRAKPRGGAFPGNEAGRMQSMILRWLIRSLLLLVLSFLVSVWSTSCSVSTLPIIRAHEIRASGYFRLHHAGWKPANHHGRC